MENHDELSTTLDRLATAASRIEQLVDRLATRHAEGEEATIGRIVAQVEDRRALDLEQKLAVVERSLAEKEQHIAELEAHTAAVREPAPESAGRKTIAATAANLLAKHGVSLDSLEAGSLDAALTGLSLEQRIAVKAKLLRAGLLS